MADTAPDMESALLARVRRRAPNTPTLPTASFHPDPTALESWRAVARSSWLNVFLVFIPISWAAATFAPGDHTLVFTTSFLAIIPLAQLLGFATEELSLRVGQTLAGLLNATLGNAVELIVAVLALLKCELRVVQSSLIGSILSNLLLVLGMCFFAGGTRFSEQGFSVAATQTNSSLLMLAVTALLLPALLRLSSSANSGMGKAPAPMSDGDILKISHGVAILLLLIYGCYLVFQLYSHSNLYDDKDNASIPPSVPYKRQRSVSFDHFPSFGTFTSATRPQLEVTIESASPTATVSSFHDLESNPAHHGEEDEEETPTINVTVCLILLVIVTLLVGVTSEFLVSSIDGLSTSTGMPKEFIGLILLPIVGNAAEHATAVTVSVKDKLTLSCQVAVGSALQIAVFVVPVLVLLGWALDKPLTLYFDPFEAVTLLLAVLTVNYVVADGKSNWLEGVVLMVLYTIIGLAVFFYAGSEPLIACT